MATVGQQLTAPESGWQRIDDNSSYIQYAGSSAWSSTTSDTNTYNHTGHYITISAATSNTIRFRFYGTKLRIIDLLYNNRVNNVNVNIDGTWYSYNPNSSANLYQVLLFEKTGLSLGVHEVTLSTSSTTGTFSLDAIDIDSSGYMVASSLTLDGQTLSFNNVYYVDASKGADATGYGTSASPFKTVNYAVTQCATSGDAIYAKAGVHDVTYISGGYGAGGLYDAGKSISFFGDPAGTVFWCDGVKNGNRDHHAVCTYGTNTKIYNIVFDMRVGTRSINYSTSFFGRDAVNVSAVCYNCVFKSDAGSPSMIYDNNNTSNVSLVNCSFSVLVNFVASYSAGSKVSRTNVACNKQFYTEGTIVSDQTFMTFDANWNITSSGWLHTGTGTNPDGSQANIGVYGGTYQWQQTYNPYTVPNTTGQLRTTISSMSVGDYIACTYQAANGTVGTFSNMGVTGQEIPLAGTAIPNGIFFLIKSDKGLLIADRNIQTAISWDTLNANKYVQGGLPWDNGNIIPTMTSNTAPSGIASAASESYPAYKAFDHSTATGNYWDSVSITPTWLQYEFTAATKIMAYAITSYNTTVRTYDPKDWTFEGSNDGVSWTILDSNAGQTFTQTQRKVFFLQNTTAYKKYRIRITANNGAANYDTVIQELEMMDTTGVIRSLTGGNGYADANNLSVLTQPSPSLGMFPTNNEYDTYIKKSTLNGKITAGDDTVWHYKYIWSWCQETPQNGTWKENATGATAASANTNRINRGNDNGASAWKDGNFSGSSVTVPTGGTVGFRPVVEYTE